MNPHDHDACRKQDPHINCDHMQDLRLQFYHEDVWGERVLAFCVCVYIYLNLVSSAIGNSKVAL